MGGAESLTCLVGANSFAEGGANLWERIYSRNGDHPSTEPSGIPLTPALSRRERGSVCAGEEFLARS
jgi:hypothetical protein